MLRQLSYATRLVAATAALALPAVAHAQDNRPVVVVFRFDNNSIGSGAGDFAGTQTGIQDLLITDLAGNAKIRIVDRSHLGEILNEQNLSKTGQVDAATAVRLGKILNAQYAVTGGFMSDGKGKVILTGRTIDIETTQIGTPTKIEGKADDVLGAITQLSTRLSSTMNLAPKPGAPRRGDAGEPSKGEPAKGTDAAKATQAGTTKTPATEQYAKGTTNAATMKVKLDAPTLKTYSLALDEMDKKNNAKAKELFGEVLKKFPGFEPAVNNLAKLNGAKAGN